MSAKAGDQSTKTFFRWHWLERPGLALPALYALSTSIGMLFQSAYFDALGIDILHYVDSTDLLMASIRQPVVWLILLASIIVVQLDNVSSARFGRRKRSRWLAWYGVPAYRRLNLLVGVVLVAFLIVIWAHASAKKVTSGNSRPVQIVFSEDGSRVDGTLIGTNNRFLFLYHPSSDTHLAYPFEGLRSIQLTGGIEPITSPARQPVVEAETDARAKLTESEDKPVAAFE